MSLGRVWRIKKILVQRNMNCNRKEGTEGEEKSQRSTYLEAERLRLPNSHDVILDHFVHVRTLLTWKIAPLVDFGSVSRFGKYAKRMDYIGAKKARNATYVCEEGVSVKSWSGVASAVGYWGLDFNVGVCKGDSEVDRQGHEVYLAEEHGLL